eukprot:gene9863-10021_t
MPPKGTIQSAVNDDDDDDFDWDDLEEDDTQSPATLANPVVNVGPIPFRERDSESRLISSSAAGGGEQAEQQVEEQEEEERRRQQVLRQLQGPDTQLESGLKPQFRATLHPGRMKKRSWCQQRSAMVLLAGALLSVCFCV